MNTRSVFFSLVIGMGLSLFVSGEAFGETEVVCPPHAGGFPGEPGLLDTDKGKITRIHNKTIRAVAQAVCDSGICGNGTVEPGEQCDEGTETATCDIDCTFAFCGDRFVNVTAGEECDDGNLFGDDGCSVSCLEDFPPFCGDGVPEGLEECDDGNQVDTDNCTNACTNAFCGDGIIWNDAATGGFEVCDDSGESSTCDSDCTVASCGDGTTNPAAGEECDDGNNVGGDGCTATCMLDSSGTYSINPDIIYSCGILGFFTLIDIHISEFDFSVNGTSLTIDGLEAPVAMTGFVDGPNFEASGSIAGSVTEIYAISGGFISPDDWIGTFTITLIGDTSLTDCFDQQFGNIAGTRVVP